MRAENFARLKAVEIRPGGNLVQITGRNGEGRTWRASNAIWATLKGKAAAPAVPVRQGAEEANLRLQLGGDSVNLTITRNFRVGKDGGVTTSLFVTTADGKKVATSPQAVLNTLIRRFAINPLAFAERPRTSLTRSSRWCRISTSTPPLPSASSCSTSAPWSTACANGLHANVAAMDNIPLGPQPARVNVSDLARKSSEALAQREGPARKGKHRQLHRRRKANTR